MSRDADPLFQIWAAGDAPPGFAARVVDVHARALAGSELVPPRSRRWRLAVAALAAVLALAIAVVVVLRPRARMPRLTPGVVVASERRTIALGDRAALVAEPGAVVAWRQDRGVLVEQRAGDVFYRVQPGTRFAVETPAGSIEVTGTSFRVEVHMPGKRDVVVAAVGAAVAVAATVLVYEGTVTARTSRGAIEAHAGDRVELAPGELPVAREGATVPPRGVLPPEVELAQLEVRVSELEAQVAARAAAGVAPGASVIGAAGAIEPPEKKAFDFTAAELRWLAVRCEVRYDIPWWALRGFTGAPGERAELLRAGVSEDEADVMLSALVAGDPALAAELRALYIEVTGDRAGADSLSLRNLQHEIFEKSRPEDLQEALRRISAERAGESAPPQDPASRPAVERLLRVLVNSGDLLERSLAADLGAARARALRTQGAGWGRRQQGGCPD